MRRFRFTILVIIWLLTGLQPSVAREEINPASWKPKIDYGFIESSVGKPFLFKELKEVPGGVPNCVAAALRAGGYYPAFVLKGTDDFYNDELPTCFKKIESTEQPLPGDLGIIAYGPLLHHAVLFLDSDRIFEKPSPNEEHLFTNNSWTHWLQDLKKQPKGYSAEVWRYTGQPGCQIPKLNQTFHNLPPNSLLKRAAKAIDQRIQRANWTETIHELSALDLRHHRKQNNQYMNAVVLPALEKVAMSERYKVFEYVWMDFVEALTGNALQMKGVR